MSKELSELQRALLGQAPNYATFTQKEFDQAIAIAQGEIMHVAIETTKKAILLEREECAKLVEEAAASEDEGDTSTALKNAAEAIRNRIPSQRQ